MELLGYSMRLGIHNRLKSDIHLDFVLFIVNRLFESLPEKSKTSAKATPKLSEDKVKQCVDGRLNGEYPPKAVAKMAAVVALCVQYEADFRPNMSIVVKPLQPLLNTRSGSPTTETPNY
ncbi:hypothetical protein ACP275_11G121400 [Erythranthe tilingii]